MSLIFCMGSNEPEDVQNLTGCIILNNTAFSYARITY